MLNSYFYLGEGYYSLFLTDQRNQRKKGRHKKLAKLHELNTWDVNVRNALIEIK